MKWRAIETARGVRCRVLEARRRRAAGVLPRRRRPAPPTTRSSTGSPAAIPSSPPSCPATAIDRRRAARGHARLHPARLGRGRRPRPRPPAPGRSLDGRDDRRRDGLPRPGDLGKLVLAERGRPLDRRAPDPRRLHDAAVRARRGALPRPARGSALLTGGLDLNDMDALKTFYLGQPRRLAMAGKILFPVPNRRLCKRLYRLTAPTLVAVGRARPPDPAGLRRALGPAHPRRRVERIASAGHMLPWEAPDEFADAITRVSRLT